MKTKESRFQVHDELTAPERSLPVLKGALAGGGQLPNFLGVLGGSPAALRAYARFRSELRNGSLQWPPSSGSRSPWPSTRAATTRRHCCSAPPATRASASTRSRSPREFDSHDEHEAALLRFIKALVETDAAARRCTSTRRRARRAGATSRSSRRSRTSSLATFTDLVTRAGDVPVDGSLGGDAPAAAACREGVYDGDRGDGRDGSSSTPKRARLLLALPPGGRAGRQALDGRDRCSCCSTGPLRFSEIRRAACRTSPTACCPSA